MKYLVSTPVTTLEHDPTNGLLNAKANATMIAHAILPQTYTHGGQWPALFVQD